MTKERKATLAAVWTALLVAAGYAKDALGGYKAVKDFIQSGGWHDMGLAAQMLYSVLGWLYWPITTISLAWWFWTVIQNIEANTTKVLKDKIAALAERAPWPNHLVIQSINLVPIEATAFVRANQTNQMLRFRVRPFGNTPFQVEVTFSRVSIRLVGPGGPTGSLGAFKCSGTLVSGAYLDKPEWIECPLTPAQASELMKTTEGRTVQVSAMFSAEAKWLDQTEVVSPEKEARFILTP